MVLVGGIGFWASQAHNSSDLIVHGQIEQHLECQLVVSSEHRLVGYQRFSSTVHVLKPDQFPRQIPIRVGRSPIQHLGCTDNTLFCISKAGEIYIADQHIQFGGKVSRASVDNSRAKWHQQASFSFGAPPNQGSNPFGRPTNQYSFGGSGTNSVDLSATPSFILDTKVEQLACGRSHSMVLCDQKLYTLNVSAGTLVPVKLEFTPVSVYCAGNFTLVLDSCNSLWAQGTTAAGKPVLDIPNPDKFTKIHPTIQAKQVACGSNHVAWIELDGSLKSWGLWGDEVKDLLPHARYVYAGHNNLWALDEEYRVYSGEGSVPCFGGEQPGRAFGPDETLNANLFPVSSPSGKWNEMHDLIQQDAINHLIASDLPAAWNDASNPPPSLTSWSEYHRIATEIRSKLSETAQTARKRMNQLNEKSEAILVKLNELEDQVHAMRLEYHEDMTAATHAREEQNLSNYWINLVDIKLKQTEKQAEREMALNTELVKNLREKRLEQWDSTELNALLWRMELPELHERFQDYGINGENLCSWEKDHWKEVGLKDLQIAKILYHVPLMRTAEYGTHLEDSSDSDCRVCAHRTPLDTENLLRELKIPMSVRPDREWVMPYLIYRSVPRSDVKNNIQQWIEVNGQLLQLRKEHEDHLRQMDPQSIVDSSGFSKQQ